MIDRVARERSAQLQHLVRLRVNGVMQLMGGVGPCSDAAESCTVL